MTLIEHYWAEGPSAGAGTPLEELFDLIARRPAFWASAACRDADPSVTWFPERGDYLAVAQALSVCASCPVVDECREWADAQTDSLAGIWGGLSGKQRRARRWPKAG